MRRSALSVASALVLAPVAVTCVPDGVSTGVAVNFGDGVRASHVGDPKAPTLQVVAPVSLQSFNFETEGYLDGVTVVVNEQGTATPIEAPKLSATGFPLRSNGGFTGTITLEMPSPFTDLDTFDAYCSSRGRTVDLSVQVYVPALDGDPDEPPPFVTASVTAPIVETTKPPAPAVFVGSPSTSGSSGSDEAPRPLEIAAAPDGAVVFALQELGVNLQPEPDPYCDPDFECCDCGPPEPKPKVGPPEFSVFEAHDGGVSVVSAAASLGEAPRLATNPGGDLVYAGRSHGEPAVIVRAQVDGGPWEAQIEPASFAAPSSGVVHAAAVSLGAAALYVALQTSVTMDGAVDPMTSDPEPLSPPEGKYYGSLLYQFDPLTGALLSAVVSPRDILAMAELADGRLVVTGELPPRNEDAMLRVERLDATGAVAWTYEEPIVSYRVSVSPVADGGFVVTTEDRGVADGVVLLRLAADGSVVYRLRALGVGVSAAARPDGSALWTFTGSLAGLAAPAGAPLPARPVPLLVEVSPAGQIVRAAQLGCAGWSAVGRSAAGEILLLGSFADWFTVGSEIREATREMIFVSRLE